MSESLSAETQLTPGNFCLENTWVDEEGDGENKY